MPITAAYKTHDRHGLMALRSSSIGIAADAAYDLVLAPYGQGEKR